MESIEYLGGRRGFEIHASIGGAEEGDKGGEEGEREKEREREKREGEERGYELLPLPGGAGGDQVRIEAASSLRDKEEEMFKDRARGEEDLGVGEEGSSEDRGESTMKNDDQTTGQTGVHTNDVENHRFVDQLLVEDGSPSSAIPDLEYLSSSSPPHSHLSLLPLPTLDLSCSLPDEGLGVSFSPLERRPTPSGESPVEWYVSNAEEQAYEGLNYDDGDEDGQYPSYPSADLQLMGKYSRVRRWRGRCHVIGVRRSLGVRSRIWTAQGGGRSGAARGEDEQVVERAGDQVGGCCRGCWWIECGQGDSLHSRYV